MRRLLAVVVSAIFGGSHHVDHRHQVDGRGRTATFVAVLGSLSLLVAGCAGVGSTLPAATGTTARLDQSSTTEARVDTSTTETDGSSTTTRSIDLVVIGDSFVAWSEWPDMYAELAADALASSVALDVSLAGPGTPRRLDQLLASDSARDVVASADVLVVQPQPGWAAAPAFGAYFNGNCGGESNTDCLESVVEEFGSYTEEYLDLLLDLAAPGTIMRVVSTASWGPEGFYPHLRDEDPEVLSLFIDTVVAMMKASEDAAARRGIPTIDVNAAFNGPSYKEPAPDDYLNSDRLHLARAGSEIVADLLHDLGYEPTVTD